MRAMSRVHRVTVPTVLSIAGSDSGGGAGIQADLKAFARCGVHGMTAITAITAQNTVGVTEVEQVSPELILAQVRAVAEDIGVDAVKIGMLGTEETVDAVVEALAMVGEAPVVVDPVMVAESGARLLAPDAQQALVELILPRASVLTPNLPEARVLVGVSRSDERERDEEGPDAERETAQVQQLARALLALGPGAVVLTGGHRTRMVDLFLDRGEGAQPVEIAGERYPDGAAHGSGCTHSSLLAAQLALGAAPLQAARTAHALTAEAVRAGLRDLGAGAGPVDVLGLAQIRTQADEQAGS
jgi:hydroxymethylpyrimidine/phosphomethylpyrimidine kinase